MIVRAKDKIGIFTLLAIFLLGYMENQDHENQKEAKVYSNTYSQDHYYVAVK